ncbi:MAG: nicotinate (nicotinamide) nucleotide adenylyltransferase [Planctomycetota bacterium]
MQRVGVFGGSFDPIHMGHLWIGEAAKEQLRLDQLRWVPAATSPLKRHGATASASDRLEMVRLAVSGDSQSIVDDREIQRGEISYTVDTIRDLHEENPGAERFLIIGSDSLASMTQWHQPDLLLSLVTLAVVQRGGEPEIDFGSLKSLISAEQIECFRQHVIRMPVIEISSSEIRQRVSEHRSIRHRVPRPVEAFIQAKQLYG